MRRLLCVLLLLAGPAAAQDLDAVGSRLRAEVLLPLYADYRDRAAAFAAVAPDCAGDWRPAVRDGYARSVLAWRRLEAAATGPALAGETPSTVYFWPDKHGTAGRQLAAALRERNPALTDPAQLAGRSVGLQSLGSFTTSFTRMFEKSPAAYRASFPPAVSQVVVPSCVVRAYGRPQHRPAGRD